jgi:hypothetical protein
MLGPFTRLFARPYRPKTTPKKTAAIVVPLSDRDKLLPDEEVSMRHLLHFLGDYDKYLVAPPKVSSSHPGFTVIKFHRKFFGSAAAHNQLLMWSGFYRAFSDYEYVLVYHLDSLVFSDDIAQWCHDGIDYIGAPWIPCADTPWVKQPHVGNGGFTLMKVESVLKVLHNRHRMEPATYWIDILLRNSSRFRSIFSILRRLQRLFPRARFINRLLADFEKSRKPEVFGCNNDFFWSFHAVKYFPEFRVASVEEGLRFAFEACPRRCFELNAGQMPFGCHAWTKFDRNFWEPHLLRPVPT